MSIHLKTQNFKTGLSLAEKAPNASVKLEIRGDLANQHTSAVADAILQNQQIKDILEKHIDTKNDIRNITISIPINPVMPGQLLGHISLEQTHYVIGRHPIPIATRTHIPITPAVHSAIQAIVAAQHCVI